MNRSCLFFGKLHLVALLVLSVAGHLQGGDDEQESPLTILSETEVNSAQYYIDGGDSKEDKKRTELGAGEKVTLTLVAKPTLIGKIEKIDWAVEKGKEYVNFPGNTKGKMKIDFTIKKTLPEPEGTVVIAVRTENCDRPGKKVLKAIRPRKGLTAKDINDHWGVKDGDRELYGISTKLEVSMEPKHVSFSNLVVMEQDDDPPGNPGYTLWHPHQPEDIPKEEGPIGTTSVTEKNTFGDQIGTKGLPVVGLDQHWPDGSPVHVLPQEWTWKSSWHTTEDEKTSSFKLDDSDMKWRFEWVIVKETYEVLCTVSKFGITVSRSTAEGNKHESNTDN